MPDFCHRCFWLKLKLNFKLPYQNNAQMPDFSSKMRSKQLKKVFDALDEFSKSEAVDIFCHAENLRPPGILALWAQDDLTKDARETKIYLKAIRLVRSVWRESSVLPRFFKIRKVTPDDTSRRTCGT